MRYRNANTRILVKSCKQNSLPTISKGQNLTKNCVALKNNIFTMNAKTTTMNTDRALMFCMYSSSCFSCDKQISIKATDGRIVRTDIKMS